MKGQRIIAYIIDVVIIGIISGILCALLGLSLVTWWAEPGFRIIYNPVSWVSFGVSVLYFMMDVWNGGSVGKRLLGLTVTITAPGRERVSTAFIRAFLKVISIHLIFGIIVFLIWDAHTSFHDRIAGTQVNRRDSVAQPGS